MITKHYTNGTQKFVSLLLQFVSLLEKTTDVYHLINLGRSENGVGPFWLQPASSSRPIVPFPGVSDIGSPLTGLLSGRLLCCR